MGRRAVGVGPVGRRHEDVAVLHAGVELDLATGPAAELGVEGLDHLGGLLGGRMAAGEVDHRAVVADGGEVAAVGDLVGRQPEAERGRLDRRPAGVVLGGVVAEDRHVADVAARRQPGGITAARPTSPRAASAASVGIDATSSGVRPSSAATGRSAHPSGTHTTYFTPAVWQRPTVAPEPRTRRPGRVRQLTAARTWARTAATSAGSTSQRSGRSSRSARRAGTSGRIPVACSTASGNLAGWAVARATIGDSPGAARAGGADADRGVRVDQDPGGVVHVADHRQGLVVVERGGLEPVGR